MNADGETGRNRALEMTLESMARIKREQDGETGRLVVAKKQVLDAVQAFYVSIGTDRNAEMARLADAAIDRLIVTAQATLRSQLTSAQEALRVTRLGLEKAKRQCERVVACEAAGTASTIARFAIDGIDAALAQSILKDDAGIPLATLE